MAATLRSLYAFLIALFAGLESFANAFANLGKVAEQASGQYVDEAVILRQIQANKFAADIKASQEATGIQQLTVTAPASTVMPSA